MNTPEILQKSNSWKHFRTHLQSLNKKEKGDSFEALTKHFLQLHPKYTTQLKNVWLLEEVPPKIHKYLNLPDQDEGIDLIAETKDGKFWAIQCKYRERETSCGFDSRPSHQINKEVRTFRHQPRAMCFKYSYGSLWWRIQVARPPHRPTKSGANPTP